MYPHLPFDDINKILTQSNPWLTDYHLLRVCIFVTIAVAAAATAVAVAWEVLTKFSKNNSIASGAIYARLGVIF